VARGAAKAIKLTSNKAEQEKLAPGNKQSGAKRGRPASNAASTVILNDSDELMTSNTINSLEDKAHMQYALSTRTGGASSNRKHKSRKEQATVGEFRNPSLPSRSLSHHLQSYGQVQQQQQQQQLNGVGSTGSTIGSLHESSGHSSSGGEATSSVSSPAHSPSNNSNGSHYSQIKSSISGAVVSGSTMSGSVSSLSLPVTIGTRAKAHSIACTTSTSVVGAVSSNEFSHMAHSATSSRMASRSNSINSQNALNDSNAAMSSAEQKRRCNIQYGFDRLQSMVPTLNDSKNSKFSKAVMLQKASEYIKELQDKREKRLKDLEQYKLEIEALSTKISDCQNQLPANGVSVLGSLNKTEIFEQKFNSYVKDKTVDNWKFYLFSLILKPLYENFIQHLNTSSKEDMERTFYEWQSRHCNLMQLRPSKCFIFDFSIGFFICFILLFFFF
jgi:hypothetical protein